MWAHSHWHFAAGRLVLPGGERWHSNQGAACVLWVGLVRDTVVKLTQSLAAEWADRGLQVNCVSPGIVNTALIQVCEGAGLAW